MATVVCVKCDRCGTLGTKSMKWVTKLDTIDPKKQDAIAEVMVCSNCGNSTWKFVYRESTEITPDTMVVNEMGVQP